MSIVNNIVEGVVKSLLEEIGKKVGGTGKRARRRKRTTSSTATPRTRDGRFKKAKKPARQQTSRKRTVRSRSRAKRRAY